MNNISKNSLKIIKSSGLTLALDYLTIGSGNPKTLIISGIHGNERTGNLIIAKLLNDLPKFQGTLTILPVANPLGYALGKREEPLSGLDLNRQFTGKNDGRPAFRITTSIMDLAKEYDYVIDLHNYTTAGLIQVGFSWLAGSLKVAEMLNPDVIRAPHVEEEYKTSGKLSDFLKKENVPYIIIELPHHQNIAEEQCIRVVNGIKAHLTNGGSLKTDSLLNKQFVRIKLVKASQTGVFKRNTSLNLSDSLSKGEQLGIFSILSEKEEFPIINQHEGMICEMEPSLERPVLGGETLFGIGEILKENEKKSLIGGILEQ